MRKSYKIWGSKIEKKGLFASIYNSFKSEKGKRKEAEKRLNVSKKKLIF
jgi:hypothetical protein